MKTLYFFVLILCVLLVLLGGCDFKKYTCDIYYWTGGQWEYQYTEDYWAFSEDGAIERCDNATEGYNEYCLECR